MYKLQLSLDNVEKKNIKKNVMDFNANDGDMKFYTFKTRSIYF